MKPKPIDLDIEHYDSLSKIKEIKVEWFQIDIHKKFRDEFLKIIIPIIKVNNHEDYKNKKSVFFSINVFFKWFAMDIFRLFISLTIKKFFSKKKIVIPKKYKFLNRILKNKIPINSFRKLKNFYLKQGKLEKFIKNSIRFFQINSISDIIFSKSSSGTVILFNKFMAKNLKGNKELNYYTDLSYYFKSNLYKFPTLKKSKLSKRNLFEINFLKKKIFKIFLKFDLRLSNTNKKYVQNLILDSYTFYQFHSKEITTPKKLYIGTAGSAIWAKLLCALTIMNGGKVINFEHGRGTILHYIIQKFFTDFSYVSTFFNLNHSHNKMNQKRYDKNKKFYSLHKKDVILNYPQKKIFNNFALSKLNFKPLIKRKKMKALYVSTAYLGYGAGFSPWKPDILYLKFQIKLLTLLGSNNIEVTMKPHPGGYAKTSLSLLKMLNVKVIHQKYEDIVDKEDFDFFITDHVASTVFPHMINFSKPTILFDFNSTEINKLLLDDLKSSIYIIKSKQDKKGELIFDEKLFKKYLYDIKTNKFLNMKRPIQKYYD
jgi:hypothetical protein